MKEYITRNELENHKMNLRYSFERVKSDIKSTYRAVILTATVLSGAIVFLVLL